jgi:hypothetical protein
MKSGDYGGASAILAARRIAAPSVTLIIACNTWNLKESSDVQAL